jgi:ATP-dependent Clp protease ATP-binding subunit ClpA
MVLAQDEARALKHNYIGTEHILLGLFREQEGLAARVFMSLGLDVEEVRAQVALIVGQGDEARTGQIPFTPPAKKVLELALRESLRLGHNDIGTEHLLLGLACENECVAARILLDLGVDAEKIRNEVIRLLGGPARPEIRAEPGRPEQREHAMRLRLSVMDAYVLAGERRDEVMHAVAEARDRDEARKSLVRLLGITDEQVSAVLEMRLIGFNQSDVAYIRSERELIRERLGQTEG